MSNIDREWEDFKNKVIPKDAPKVQFEEMEKAFYAGVIATVAGIARLAEKTNTKTKVLIDLRALIEMVDDISENLDRHIAAKN